MSFANNAVVAANYMKGFASGSLVSVAKNASVTGNYLEQTAPKCAVKLGNGAAGSATNVVVQGNNLVKTDAAGAADNFAVVAPAAGDQSAAATSSCLIVDNTVQGRWANPLGAATFGNNIVNSALDGATSGLIGSGTGGALHTLNSGTGAGIGPALVLKKAGVIEGWITDSGYMEGGAGTDLAVAAGPGKYIRFYVNGGGSGVTALLDLAGSFTPGGDNTQTLGSAAKRWSTVYAGTGAINTSDARQKQQVQDIGATVLRAWAKVKFCQFKFNDAVALKGDGARWHFGVLAQQVKEAFESEGLDAFAYGLLCYDEWQEEGDTPAGNRYGIRYDEALILECAYLRSRLQ